MTNKPPIRVVIVDDHDILRHGLANLLATEPDIELVGEGSNGLQALQLCETLQPDVLLLDLQMPGLDGMAAALRIRASHPHIRIIILTAFVRIGEIKEALKTGIAGYLVKDLSASELIAAVRAAHAGESALAPQVITELVDDLQQPPAPHYDLTEREQEIVELLTQGLANKQIAARLCIALPTVKRHTSNILHKLHVPNRTALVALVAERKWHNN